MIVDAFLLAMATGVFFFLVLVTLQIIPKILQQENKPDFPHGKK
jgi:hypothetical protein